MILKLPNLSFLGKSHKMITHCIKIFFLSFFAKSPILFQKPKLTFLRVNFVKDWFNESFSSRLAQLKGHFTLHWQNQYKKLIWTKASRTNNTSIWKSAYHYNRKPLKHIWLRSMHYMIFLQLHFNIVLAGWLDFSLFVPAYLQWWTEVATI